MIEFYKGVVDIIDQPNKHTYEYNRRHLERFRESAKPAGTVKNMKPFAECNKTILLATGERKS